jgi:hypothetical protein
VFFVLGDQGKHFQYSTTTQQNSWSLPDISAFTSATQYRVVNRGIAYGNGVYVGVGENLSYTAYSSSPGGPWKLAPFSTSGMKVRVKFGLGKFLTIYPGSNYVYTSTDGQSWSSAGGVGTYPWQDIAFGDVNGSGRFVIISTDGKIAFSGNSALSVWATNVSPMPSGNDYGDWLSIDYYGGKFYAMSLNGWLATSSDGGVSFSVEKALCNSNDLPSDVPLEKCGIASMRIDPVTGMFVAQYVHKDRPSSINGVYISNDLGTIWCLTKRNYTWFRAVSAGNGYIFSGGTGGSLHYALESSCGTCNGIDCEAGFTTLRFSNGLILPLYKIKETSPAIGVKDVDGNICWAGLVQGVYSGALNMNVAGTIYHSKMLQN